MVGIAVATMVLSIAAMNIVAMVAAKTQGRLDALTETVWAGVAEWASTEEGSDKAAPIAKVRSEASPGGRARPVPWPTLARVGYQPVGYLTCHAVGCALWSARNAREPSDVRLEEHRPQQGRAA